MFRITKADHARHSVLTVDGDLYSDCVETVERCCRQAMARGVPVDLFLREVSNIDATGRALLRKLADMGIRLCGAGVYTSYILRGMSPAESDPARRVK
jgi:hypothetical protein